MCRSGFQTERTSRVKVVTMALVALLTVIGTHKPTSTPTRMPEPMHTHEHERTHARRARERTHVCAQAQIHIRAHECMQQPRRLFLHFSSARRRSSTSPAWQVTSPWPSHSQIRPWRRTSSHHHRQVSLADAANLQAMLRVVSKTAILTPARPRVGVAVPFLVRSQKRPPGQSGHRLGPFAPRPTRTSVHSHLGF